MKVKKKFLAMVVVATMSLMSPLKLARLEKLQTRRPNMEATRRAVERNGVDPRRSLLVRREERRRVQTATIVIMKSPRRRRSQLEEEKPMGTPLL